MKVKELFFREGDAIYFRKPYTRDKRHYVVTESFDGCPKDNSNKLRLIGAYETSSKRIGVICSDTVMFDVFVNGTDDDNIYTPICSDMNLVGMGFDAIVVMPLPSGKNTDWVKMIIEQRLNK